MRSHTTTIKDLSTEECKEALTQEEDPNILRACVAYLELIRAAKAQRATGQVVTDLQLGTVKGVRPDYTLRVA